MRLTLDRWDSNVVLTGEEKQSKFNRIVIDLPYVPDVWQLWHIGLARIFGCSLFLAFRAHELKGKSIFFRRKLLGNIVKLAPRCSIQHTDTSNANVNTKTKAKVNTNTKDFQKLVYTNVFSSHQKDILGISSVG